MKRFFCIECKKLKRVRNLPKNLSERDNPNPVNRIGRCKKHNSASLKDVKHA